MPQQRVSFGIGALAEIRESLARAQVGKVLLVTGGESFTASGAERALSPMLSGLEARRFQDFTPNPIFSDVEHGVALCRELRPDVVVAVGGGSVIDIAKAINLLASQEASPAAIMAQQSLVLKRPRALIAVPTTAGTGSEATHFATIYVGGVKQSLTHEWMRPDHAIVDPSLTFSKPPQLTAITGLDALSQAIESYWAVKATSDSQALAAEAIALLWRKLATAVWAPDAVARNDMARGAHLAGRAIDISKTTAAHAIAYALTIRYGVAHGHAVALTLGRFFEHNAKARMLDVNDPRGVDYVESTMADLCRLLGCQTPGEAASAWDELLTSLNIPADLRSVGLEADAVESLADAVNTERLGNHPVRVTPDALREILAGLACGVRSS